jgi:hypothetical protein
MNRPILPTWAVCHNAWRIRGSWTDLVIPKPFSTVTLLAGEPLHVPAGVDREELNRFVVKLQAEMDRLEARAEQLLHGTNQQPLAKAA